MAVRREVVVQLAEDLVSAVDQRAARNGITRSEVFAAALADYLRDEREAEIDRRIVDAYTRTPQEEDPSIEAAARRSIEAEPW